MRWLSYAHGAELPRLGVLRGDAVHGLAPGASLVDLLRQGGEAVAVATERLATNPDHVAPLADVQLRLPLEPTTIRDSAGFIQHLRNVASATGRVIDERFTEFPPFYFSNPAAALGPADDVRIPFGTEQFDFELEVGAVLGAEGADIAVADAESYIFGYVIFCDYSARDIQMRERDLFGPVKGKDSANGFGPFVVTPDELEPHRSNKSFDLGMRAYVNDEMVSEGNWDTIDWGFPDMIAFASRGTRVRPGDVLGSGTVPTGCLFEHFCLDPEKFRGWLQPGDEVRLEVDGLGELRQRLVAPAGVQRLSSGY